MSNAVELAVEPVAAPLSNAVLFAVEPDAAAVLPEAAPEVPVILCV